MSTGYDFVIVGGGVIGASVAFHLAELSDARVALFERGEVCGGGTGRSCAIIRSHYSVSSNTALALRSLDAFRDFREALGEDDVACGFVNSGYLIVAGEGPFADRLSDNLAAQRDVGADTRAVGRAEARALHPHLALDDVAVIGWEPASGYADPVATTQGFLTAARRRGVAVFPRTPVERLLVEPCEAAAPRHRAGSDRTAEPGRAGAGRVAGVVTPGGPIRAGRVVSAVGPWTGQLFAASGLPAAAVARLRLEVSRHVVLTFAGPSPYAAELPIVKDLTVDNKMYFRPAAGSVVLAGTGDFGEPVAHPGRSRRPKRPHRPRRPPGRPPRRPDRPPAGADRGADARLRGRPAHGRVGGTVRQSRRTGIPCSARHRTSPASTSPTASRGTGSSSPRRSGALRGAVAARCQSRMIDLTPYRHERFEEGALLVGAYGGGSIS